jgi:hypothetical protein
LRGLFHTNSVDTIVSSLSISVYSLTGLTKYYWRVAGVNSEGESRWSDVWNFATGATADVKNFPNSSAISISPNPAMSEITFHYFAANSLNTHFEIFDLLGNRIIGAEDNNNSIGEREMKFDVSKFPQGMYILRTQSERQIVMEKFSVLR